MIVHQNWYMKIRQNTEKWMIHKTHIRKTTARRDEDDLPRHVGKFLREIVACTWPPRCIVHVRWRKSGGMWLSTGSWLSGRVLRSSSCSVITDVLSSSPSRAVSWLWKRWNTAEWSKHACVKTECEGTFLCLFNLWIHAKGTSDPTTHN